MSVPIQTVRGLEAQVKLLHKQIEAFAHKLGLGEPDYPDPEFRAAQIISMIDLLQERLRTKESGK